VKRILDLLLVLFTAPLWLPALGVTALAARLALGRSVFSRQERAGLPLHDVFPSLSF